MKIWPPRLLAVFVIITIMTLLYFMVRDKIKPNILPIVLTLALIPVYLTVAVVIPPVQSTKPVDCQVSEWSNWSACDPNTGKRSRSREVTQSPLNGGQECGPLTDVQDCVDCVVGDWGDWSTCSEVCGGGEKIRTRSIVQPPANGGNQCPTLTETQPCNEQTCPSNCEFTEWSEWGACDPNTGTKTRTRQIINGGRECGPLNETQSCNNTNQCIVGDWSEWSMCSASCGGGEQARTRSIIQHGDNCPPLTETRSCNVQDCPQCAYSEWSSWSACNPDTGTQTRTRKVTNGAQNCGPLTETRLCPVDCVLQDWTWGECEGECGGATGTQIGKRNIKINAQNGGSCPDENSSERMTTRECTTPECPTETVESITMDGDSNLKDTNGNILTQPNISQITANTFASGVRRIQDIHDIWNNTIYYPNSSDKNYSEGIEYYTKIGDVVKVSGAIRLSGDPAETTRKFAIAVPIQPYITDLSKKATMTPFYDVDGNRAGYQTKQLHGIVNVLTSNRSGDSPNFIDPSPNAYTWYNNFVNNLNAKGACVGFISVDGSNADKLHVSIQLHDGGQPYNVIVNYSYTYGMKL